MDCYGCFKLRGNRCLAFTEKPANCWAKVTDAKIYLKELDDLIELNTGNSNFLVKLRREREAFMKEYGLVVTNSSWYEVYLEDRRRGCGGGSSEQDSNNKTSLKQKMKDNRPVECKESIAQNREQVKEELEKFEEEHGKLEKLSRSPVSRSKIDSYTGTKV